MPEGLNINVFGRKGGFFKKDLTLVTNSKYNSGNFKFRLGISYLYSNPRITFDLIFMTF